MSNTTERDRADTATVPVGGAAQSEPPDVRAERPATQGTALMHVRMTVNGRVRAMTVEPRMTLLDALRDELGLTGTKKSRDRGECGACTMHVEGRRVLSCMTLAAMQEGKRITTIEGAFARSRPLGLRSPSRPTRTLHSSPSVAEGLYHCEAWEGVPWASVCTRLLAFA